MKAGLTGPLVLSTLHTIDAPSAIGRLADIGIDMGARSGAFNSVVALRLIRRHCDACAQPVTLVDLPPEQQMLMLAGTRAADSSQHIQTIRRLRENACHGIHQP